MQAKKQSSTRSSARTRFIARTKEALDPETLAMLGRAAMRRLR